MQCPGHGSSTRHRLHWRRVGTRPEACPVLPRPPPRVQAHIQAAEALGEGGTASPLAGRAYFVTNCDPRPFWGFLGDVCEGLGYGRPRIRCARHGRQSRARLPVAGPAHATRLTTRHRHLPAAAPWPRAGCPLQSSTPSPCSCNTLWSRCCTSLAVTCRRGGEQRSRTRACVAAAWRQLPRLYTCGNPLACILIPPPASPPRPRVSSPCAERLHALPHHPGRLQPHLLLRRCVPRLWIRAGGAQGSLGHTRLGRQRWPGTRAPPSLW